MIIDNSDTPTGADKSVRMDIEYLIRHVKEMTEAPSPVIQLRRKLCIEALQLASAMITGDFVSK